MNATLSTRQLRLAALLVGVVVLAGAYLVVGHKSKSPSTATSTPVTTTPTPSKSNPSNVTPVKPGTHGLPVPVARALETHKVVVVSLTNPRGVDDSITTAEAKAGAEEMGAGYVFINVFHQRPGIAILHKLGVVDMPATLVVKRPGLVYSQFPGFVDRDVVAQAVADARS